jgi:hypothetical protein
MGPVAEDAFKNQTEDGAQILQRNYRWTSISEKKMVEKY